MSGRPDIVNNPRFHVPGGIWEEAGSFLTEKLEEIGRVMAASGSPVSKIVGRASGNDALVEWMPDRGWFASSSPDPYDRSRHLLRVRDRSGNYGFGFVEARSDRGVYATFPNGGSLCTVRLPEESVAVLPQRIHARIHSLFRDDEGFWRDEDTVTVDVTDAVLSLSAEEICALKDNDPSSDVIASLAGFDEPCRVEIVDSIAAYFDHTPESLGRGAAAANISEFSIEQNRSIMERARMDARPRIGPDAEPGMSPSL